MFPHPEGRVLTQYYLRRLVSALGWGRRGTRLGYTVPVSAIIKALKSSSLNYFGLAWWGAEGWEGAHTLRQRRWLPVILRQGTSVSLVAKGM